MNLMSFFILFPPPHTTITVLVQILITAHLDRCSGFLLPISLSSGLATPPGHTLCCNQGNLLISGYPHSYLNKAIGSCCALDKSKLLNMIFKVLQNPISLYSFSLTPCHILSMYTYNTGVIATVDDSLLLNHKLYFICHTHVFPWQILQKMLPSSLPQQCYPSLPTYTFRFPGLVLHTLQRPVEMPSLLKKLSWFPPKVFLG